MNRTPSPPIAPTRRSFPRSGVLFLVLALLIASPAGVRAQDTLTPAEELDKLSASVKSHPGFTADFTQTLSPPNSAEIHSTGNLVFARGGKMILHYADPPGQVLLLLGNRMSFYVPQNGQLLKKTLKSRTIPETPALLLEKIGQLDRYFYIRPESATHHLKGATISLVPKDADRHLALARITIDRKTWLPRTIVFMEVNGVMLSIHLTHLRQTASIAEKDFTLVVPPGTTVAQSPGGSD